MNHSSCEAPLVRTTQIECRILILSACTPELSYGGMFLCCDTGSSSSAVHVTFHAILSGQIGVSSSCVCPSFSLSPGRPMRQVVTW